jgi:hypothetical protein
MVNELNFTRYSGRGGERQIYDIWDTIFEENICIYG